MATSLGGGGSAPSPGWLMRAALASCDATIVAMEAARAGIELTDLTVTVVSESDNRGVLGVGDAVPAWSAVGARPHRARREQRDRRRAARARPSCGVALGGRRRDRARGRGDDRDRHALIGRPTTSASRSPESSSASALSGCAPTASRVLLKKQRTAAASTTSRISASVRPRRAEAVDVGLRDARPRRRRPCRRSSHDGDVGVVEARRRGGRPRPLTHARPGSEEAGRRGPSRGRACSSSSGAGGRRPSVASS